MASISQLLTRPNTNSFHLSSPCLSNNTTTLLPIQNHKTKSPSPIHCNINDHNTTQNPKPKLDRRDILVGLGGLSAAALSLPSLAADTATVADKFPLPQFDKCQQSTLPVRNNVSAFPPTNCCPSFRTDDITEFVLPDRSVPLRVRAPAHLAKQDYIDKYNLGIEKMKNLQCSDPRSFTEQAKVHCAYCNGFYPTSGSEHPLQIHFNALFFPWHRLYLYFYERILCNLLDDDKFAIPFWNWDAPLGMTITDMFALQKFGNKKNYLYNENRNPARYGTVIDLSYSANPAPAGTSNETLIKENLATVHRQVVGKSATEFLGRPFTLGVVNAGAGSLENSPHTDVHAWTGDPAKGGQDLGQFYSAGKDVLFYALHANVDRMWSIWKSLGGQEFSDSGWLDSEFLFFDETSKLRRCTVSQTLDMTKLRYNYQDVEIKWLDTPPTVTKRARSKRSAASYAYTELSAFPVVLSSVIHVKVPRPQGGEGKKEVLVVDDIEMEPDEQVSFAVFINTPDHEGIRPTGREFAGSFVSLPVHHKMVTDMHFGLTDLLADLGADQDEEIVVTLVPNDGVGKVKIGSIRIEYQSS